MSDWTPNHHPSVANWRGPTSKATPLPMDAQTLTNGTSTIPFPVEWLTPVPKRKSALTNALKSQGWNRDRVRTVHLDVAGVTRKLTVLRQ
jgi:hypothetical protein